MRTTSSPAYAFEDRVHEHERLIDQSVLFDPLTARLLQTAGIAPGMRVLDLGTGAGSVALLAARVHRAVAAPVWAWANVAGGLLPLMERLGVEGADEVRAPDLDERMLAELCAHDAVLVAPMLVGAWTRVPA